MVFCFLFQLCICDYFNTPFSMTELCCVLIFNQTKKELKAFSFIPPQPQCLLGLRSTTHGRSRPFDLRGLCPEHTCTCSFAPSRPISLCPNVTFSERRLSYNKGRPHLPRSPHPLLPAVFPPAHRHVCRLPPPREHKLGGARTLLFGSLLHPLRIAQLLAGS